MKAKYITFIDRETGEDDIIIFSWRQIHSEVARRLRLNAFGAGFVDVYQEDGRVKVNCHGKSESMGLSSKEGDSEIAARLMNI